MKEFIKKSFKRELLACFLVVALLPLIISSTFLVQLFKVKLDNDNQKKDLEQAQQIDAKLTTLFDNFEFVAGELAKDEEIRAALKAEGTKTRSEVYSRLYGETVSLRERAQVELYSADGVCLYSTGTGMFHTVLLPYWGILKVSSAHPDELIIRREKEYSGEMDILSLIHIFCLHRLQHLRGTSRPHIHPDTRALLKFFHDRPVYLLFVGGI